MKRIQINATSTLKAIQLWNGIFELTSMELEVLSFLLDVNTSDNLCSADNKKKVAKLLDIEDYRTLNNYVKRLKDKKAILYEDKIYKVNSLLNLNTNNVEVNIRRN